LPVDHYENFPVASWLLPARFRPPIEAIYAFARGADDVADEGEMSDKERLAGLDEYLRALDAIEAGGTPHARFQPIARAIAEYHLPVGLLRDLIDAFKQDVVKKRYATFDELMDYSRRSANPIGRLLLHLFEDRGLTRVRPGSDPGQTGDRSLDREQSDAICSSLQIINFWQDIGVDWRKGRVYIPQEDLARFKVSEDAIARRDARGAWRDLMAFECARARRMLQAGAPLGRTLPGRLGLEIRATVHGGAAILDKIDAVEGDVFRHRPVLTKSDWIKIIAKAVMKTGVRPQTEQRRKPGSDPKRPPGTDSG
jgi:squalene synthase HpnC